MLPPLNRRDDPRYTPLSTPYRRWKRFRFGTAIEIAMAVLLAAVLLAALFVAMAIGPTTVR